MYGDAEVTVSLSIVTVGVLPARLGFAVDVGVVASAYVNVVSLMT